METKPPFGGKNKDHETDAITHFMVEPILMWEKEYVFIMLSNH